MLFEQTAVAPDSQASSPVPNNGKYHQEPKVSRSLLAASAGDGLHAGFRPIPNMFPADWPIGAIASYFALLGAGIYSAIVLGVLTSFSGSTLAAITAPVLVVSLEWVLVTILKYPVLRDRQISNLRAFFVKGSYLRDAHTLKASSWGWKDWVILVILILCLLAKASILVTFGAFRPPVELAINWTIAGLDFAGHASGLTTRVPCFLLAKLIDNWSRRRRLIQMEHQASTHGLESAAGLAFRERCFETPVPLRCGEIDGHQLISQGPDTYVFRAAGTLDDRARDAFLAVQTTPAAEAELAKVLVRIQLDSVEASEMPHVKIMPLPSPSTSPSSATSS